MGPIISRTSATNSSSTWTTPRERWCWDRTLTFLAERTGHLRRCRANVRADRQPAHGARRARPITLAAVTTTPGDDRPSDNQPERRSASEELEWIGAEVEARPKVMFWVTIAVAVVVVLALVAIIIVVMTSN